MNNRHNKINWESGLFITSEILNANDNFFLHYLNVLGHLNILKSYGVFPSESGRYNYHAESKIENSKIIITQLSCVAITKNGHIINFNNDMEFPYILNLDEFNNYSDIHVILKINPYKYIKLTDSDYSIPEYELSLKQINRLTDYEIPVLKIKNIGHYHWEIDEDYILPSVSLSSDPKIYAKFKLILEKIEQITSLEIKNDNLLMQLYLFQTELKNYSLSEYPFDLILLLKKICEVFTKYSENDLIKCKELADCRYDHLQIDKMLNLGVECLDEIIQNFEIKKAEEKPVKVEEDDTDSI
ncbi:MAG: hypothetical protein LBQ22_06965 [Bacteroidales bacterium]|jgi:hypothetical protein|nr:hypothetical protein [Bacteroidales bacterium]